MKNNNYQQLTRTFQRLSRFSHLSSTASLDMFTMIRFASKSGVNKTLCRYSARIVVVNKNWPPC